MKMNLIEKYLKNKENEALLIEKYGAETTKRIKEIKSIILLMQKTDIYYCQIKIDKMDILIEKEPLEIFVFEDEQEQEHV